MNPFLKDVGYKSAEELAAMWQLKALVAADGKLQRVLLAAFIEEYSAVTQTTWKTLLRNLIDGIDNIRNPIAGHGRIMQSGRVCAYVISRDRHGEPYKLLTAIFKSKDEFISEMRRLADKLRLSDIDRTEMFALLRKWIAVDYRTGPDGLKIAS